MKITAQEEYGLRCLQRLARTESDHALTIPEVAAAEHLSAAYVAKLLAVLRQGGLIESVRGRTGGYRLAREPADITLGAVLAVLGEPFFDDPGYCQRHAGNETNGHCVHEGGCNLRALWQTLEQWMSRALNEVTLADLLEGHGQLTELLRGRLAEAVLDPATPLLTLAPIHRH